MRFFKEEKGSMLIELAVSIPLLVTLVFSGLEVARFMLSHQKVSRIATSIADISSQGQTLSEAEIQNVFMATDFIAGNLDFSTKGYIILSSVSRPDSNPPIINWQRTHGTQMSPDAVSKIGSVGGTATLPTNLVLNTGEGIIVAEVYYDYDALLFGDMVGSGLVYKNAYYRPRFGSLQKILP
ncbi:MAG: pilus assembly protein [Sphingomonadales bacterium]|jgi:Flp pilus assembly protein TadG